MMWIIISVILSSSIIILATRTLWVLLKTWTNKSKPTRKRTNPAKVMIVLGSGGHTAEMLRLIKSLDPSLYTPRIYIIAKTDSTSENHLKQLEENTWDNNNGNFIIEKLPRSRELHQSYLTSIVTTLRATISSVPLLFKYRPDVVLCNGPGTCVPICYLAFVCKVFFICDPCIMFVESICRVTSLSLTGKLLTPIADEMLIQWPQLASWPRVKYIGRLH